MRQLADIVTPLGARSCVHQHPLALAIRATDRCEQWPDAGRQPVCRVRGRPRRPDGGLAAHRAPGGGDGRGHPDRHPPGWPASCSGL